MSTHAHGRVEDESRLRLAAAKGVVALQETPLFRDELDGERLVILSQVLSDPCPQLRRQWAFRIHKGIGHEAGCYTTAQGNE